MISRLEVVPMCYTFDGFTLDPRYSEVKSRRDPDISVNLKNFRYDLPVVSSPMNTVTETDMLGDVGVLHRYMTMAKMWLQSRKSNDFYVAVGANGDFEKRVTRLRDVANRHNELSVP